MVVTPAETIRSDAMSLGPTAAIDSVALIASTSSSRRPGSGRESGVRNHRYSRARDGRQGERLGDGEPPRSTTGISGWIRCRAVSSSARRESSPETTTVTAGLTRLAS
ncbi:hypothetical protein IOD13_04335 [Brevibacterium casei]|nr:hypothetical protein [Brevibacterium casei]